MKKPELLVPASDLNVFYTAVNFGADAVYCYVYAGASVPLVCASVTPVHVEGPVWAIEVDVNATFDYYSTPVKGSASSTPPTASTLKGLAASIANFPEGG